PFAEQSLNQNSADPTEGGIAEFAARVARQQSHDAAQALVDRESIGRKPEPPDAADVDRFFVDYVHFFLPPAPLKSTATRIKSFSAASSSLSVSLKSMARVPLASSPALKSFFGSLSEAPLKKFSLT